MPPRRAADRAPTSAPAGDPPAARQDDLEPVAGRAAARDRRGVDGTAGAQRRPSAHRGGVGLALEPRLGALASGAASRRRRAARRARAPRRARSARSRRAAAGARAHPSSKRKPTPRTVVDQRRVAELAPQPADVGVERLRRAPPVLVPDRRHDLVARHGLAGAARRAARAGRTPSARARARGRRATRAARRGRPARPRPRARRRLARRGAAARARARRAPTARTASSGSRRRPRRGRAPRRAPSCAR